MPSALHRGLVDLLRRDLSLVVELALGELGRAPPDGLAFAEHDGRLVGVSFVDDPRELAVDLLIVGTDRDDVAKLVATVEAQLRHDPIKRWRMLEYIAAGRRDHRCAGLQVMFSPDPEVLEKTRISFKEEAHFCPILLGPTSIPKLVDVEAALARPVLATLSAIVHVHEPEGPQIVAALLESWRRRDDQTWHDDARILWGCIPEDIMDKLNIPIQRERFQSDVWTDDDDDGEPGAWERGTGLWQRALRAGREEGREQGREQGREEGREQGREEGREQARALWLRHAWLLVLEGRGVPLTEAEQEAIAAATPEQLESWLRKP
jgi:hypothetical protein